MFGVFNLFYPYNLQWFFFLKKVFPFFVLTFIYLIFLNCDSTTINLMGRWFLIVIVTYSSVVVFIFIIIILLLIYIIHISINIIISLSIISNFSKSKILHHVLLRLTLVVVRLWHKVAFVKSFYSHLPEEVFI